MFRLQIFIYLLILISFQSTIIVAEWNQFNFLGDAPKSRLGHCMITIQSNYYNNIAPIKTNLNVKLQQQQQQQQATFVHNNNKKFSQSKSLIISETVPPIEDIQAKNNSYWIYGGIYGFSDGLVNPPLLLIKDLTGIYSELSLSGNQNPSMRWGHSCHSVIIGTATVEDSTSSDILVFGGSTDFNSTIFSGELWKFSLISNSWELLSDYSPPPPPPPSPPILVDNNLTTNDSSSSINDTISNSSSSSETKSIEFLTNTTTTPDQIFPYPRTMFGSTTNGTFLFIFGGLTNQTTLQDENNTTTTTTNNIVLENDFWIYNFQNKSWILVKQKSQNDVWPTPRYGHSMVIAQRSLYMFGGVLELSNLISITRELWRFSLDSFQWELMETDDYPEGRSFHSMVVDTKKETAFFVYGGVNSGSIELSDLWIFDLDSRDWENIETSFKSPQSSHLAMSLSSDVNGFLMYGGGGSPSEFLSYGLDCNCNGRGGCFYGICSCFSGYFGEYCQNSIDGPILLGLGLAISVPILCFGWCVLRCITLPTRMKILTLVILVMSCSLFASVRSCLSCWLPVALMGVITGVIGLLGILKYKSPKIILYFTISVFLTLGVGVYGVISFLPSCMLGNCKNDKPDDLWLPKYAIIMSFIHLAFLILVLPLSLKLYKHRRYISTISNNPSNGAIVSGGYLFTNGFIQQPQQPLNPLLKKIKENEENNNNIKSTLNDKEINNYSNNNNFSNEQNQKALNYLQKEFNLRSELNRIRISKSASEEIRVKVERGSNILEDTFRQLSMIPTQQLLQNISIKFIGEEGVDMGGLKKEWFSLLFKQLFDPLYGLFVLNSNYTLSISPTSHLQPDHLSYFLFGGKMVARSVIEGIHLDHTFSRTIYKLILGKPPSLDDLIFVDPDFHKSLRWILENSVDDMEEVTFSTTVDQVDIGHVLVDLKPNGRDILVDEENKQEFVDLMTQWRFQRDISDQAYHFIQGFKEIIPLELISNFTECELELFICGLVEIDINDWKQNTIYRGYTPTSSVIEWFWEVVEEMEIEDRIRLLQFVTGNARLPPSGFQGLSSADSVKFQIHQSFTPDNQLPVARTCFNRLDLPNYHTKEKLKFYLNLAIKEGLPGFGLA